MPELSHEAADVLALLSVGGREIVSANQTNTIIRKGTGEVIGGVDPLVMAELVMLGFLIRRDEWGFVLYTITAAGLEEAQRHNQDQ